MTNREYLEQKKETIYKKINDFFEKHLNLFYICCLIIDVVLFIAVCKISVAFLALLIPVTIFNIGFTIGMFEIWLDKEHRKVEK